MNLKSITATIKVTDLENGITFYEQLGFEKDWLWPKEEPTHASVSKDGLNFMMVKAQDEAVQKADLYFTIENVRTYHAQLMAKGMDLPEMIQSAYGMLDFSIMDPWGHHLTFGSIGDEFKP